MKWFFRGLLAVLLVGGWIVAARAVHIVHSKDVVSGQDRFGVIPKARWMLDDTYVDVRAWTPADLTAHRDFVRRLSDSPKVDLLSHIVPAEHRSDVKTWIINAMDNPAATQPSN